MLLFFGGIFITALVLVPTALVEFRYFTLPLLFLNFEIKPPSKNKDEQKSFFFRIFDDLSMNMLIYWTVNLIVFYVFIFRPYTCYEDKICRFIWW